MQILRSAVVWLLLSYICACGSSEVSGTTAWHGEISYLPSGTQLVANPESGYWADGQGWQLKETLRIGSATGDGPDVFGRIAALAVGSSGQIFAFDGFDRELRVFDATGALARRVGQRGQGPGEFEHVIGLAIGSTGPLWIVDGQLARYTVVDQNDPTQITVYSRPGGPVYLLPWAGAATLDGGLFDAILIASERSEAVARVNREGIATDTSRVAVPQIDAPRLGSMSFPIPYAARTLRHVNTDGTVWTATTHEYRLTRTSPDGDTLTVVTRAHVPAALSASQRDSVNAYVRRLRAEFGIQPRESMIPTSAPLLTWIMVDDAGFLWVGRASAGKTGVIDVFDERGRFAGSVELPFRLADGLVPVVRNGFFYAAIEDEAGVPAVFRANIIGRR